MKDYKHSDMKNNMIRAIMNAPLMLFCQNSLVLKLSLNKLEC